MEEIKEVVTITLEELEAMRLYYIEGLDQKKAGEMMKISQSTVSRHLEEAHKKLSRALLFGFAIHIMNPVDIYHCDACGHTWRIIEEEEHLQCEKCNSPKIHTHIHKNDS